MKKLVVVLLAVLMMTSAFLVGCADAPAPAASAEKSAETSAEKSTEGKKFKVGFAEKNEDNPFQQAFVKAVTEQGEALGWEVTVLDAKNSIENEQKNMETLISQAYDLIFINVVDTKAGAAMCRQAKAADIPVVAVDSSVDPSAEVVTLAACDNLGGGREVGKFLVTNYQDGEEIKAAMISGNKGNTGGQERRVGLFAGVIMGRTGMEEDKAFEAAWTFDQELTDKGKASYPDAKFTVVGQGWGNWTTDDGLTAAEDLITANSDMNCMLAENDSMLIGGKKALENSGMIDKVQLFASHDGMKEAMELIKEDGQYKATGLNIPEYVVQKAYDVAQKILLEGAAWDSFGPLVKTDAVAITKDNVDKYYDAESIF